MSESYDYDCFQANFGLKVNFLNDRLEHHGDQYQNIKEVSGSCYRPPTKLLEGYAFSHVCQSVCSE